MAASSSWRWNSAAGTWAGRALSLLMCRLKERVRQAAEADPIQLEVEPSPSSPSPSGSMAPGFSLAVCSWEPSWVLPWHVRTGRNRGCLRRHSPDDSDVMGLRSPDDSSVTGLDLHEDRLRRATGV